MPILNLFIVEAINPLANTLGSVPQASVPISAESYKNTGELKLQEMPIYGATRGYYGRPYYGSYGPYFYPVYYPYGGYYVGDSTPSSNDEGNCCCPKHTVTVVLTMMLAFTALSPGTQMGCRLC
uniref:Uncharacterized protein n=1 Tax=Meloidogyne floridensis TaxID=298350 RepID=A0A915NMF2_9BILA